MKTGSVIRWLSFQWEDNYEQIRKQTLSRAQTSKIPGSLTSRTVRNIRWLFIKELKGISISVLWVSGICAAPPHEWQEQSTDIFFFVGDTVEERHPPRTERASSDGAADASFTANGYPPSEGLGSKRRDGQLSQRLKHTLYLLPNFLIIKSMEC